jgi:uncharacterized membrane protein YtjA (UPF0391 family)
VSKLSAIVLANRQAAAAIFPAANTFYAAGDLWRSYVLKLALFFLVIALVAALFGFTGIAAAAAGIAKILFFIFIAIFVVLLIVGMMVGSALF